MMNTAVTPTQKPTLVDNDRSLVPLLWSRPSGNGLGQHYLDREHPVVAFVTRVAQATNAGEILDLGTGRGLVASALCAALPDARVTASDINAPALDELEAAARTSGADLTVQVHDAGKDTLPEGWRAAFDLVVAKDLFPFLSAEGGRHFLQSAAAALKPGGTLVFSAPHVDSRLYREGIPTDDDFVRGLTPSAQAFVQTTLDRFSFTDEAQITRALAEVGLSAEHIFRFGRANGWLCVAATKSAE